MGEDFWMAVARQCQALRESKVSYPEQVVRYELTGIEKHNEEVADEIRLRALGVRWN